MSAALRHLFMLVGDLAAARPVNSVEICVRVPDVAAAYRHLVATGVPVAGPPADQDWGARHAWLTDPGGRRMSIFS